MYPIGLESGERAILSEVVPAFGGVVSSTLEDANYAIVPGRLLSTREWTKLRPTIERCIDAKHTIVSFEWLHAVMDGGKSAWDRSLCSTHVPPFVQSVICEAVDRRSLTKKPRKREPEPSWSPWASSLLETQEFLERGGRRDAAAVERGGGRDVEAAELERAIARSLQDTAPHSLVAAAAGQTGRSDREMARELLELAPEASDAQVMSAYRRKALAAHPDKDGDAQRFRQIQWAKELLLRETPRSPTEPRRALVNHAPGKEVELKDHRALVRAKFEEDGVDLAGCVARQSRALEALGLRTREVGSTNKDEKGKLMYNQCFYLSLACSYLGGTADAAKDDIQETALQLKRVIEAAVLATHPDWAGNRVGEDVQAFSDFLFFVLGSHALLSEFSVAVCDSCSGFVEFYTGRAFPEAGREEEQRSNFLTILYVPGHYQALVATGRRPTLAEFERSLEAYGVRYVQTNL